MKCKWQLRGQGAANVVFGYCGDDPKLRGYVLRVRKPSAHVASDVDRILWDGILHSASDTYDIQYELEYVANIMAPLLGHEYVFPGVPTPLPLELREVLGSGAGSHLPALLLPDHTTFHSKAAPGYTAVGPAICLEIKPKWGLDPRRPHSTQATVVAAAAAVATTVATEVPAGCSGHPAGIHASDLRRQYPRFMLHMLHKHVTAGVPISSYSPLDLFSGDLRRMEAALRCLIRSPSNNLTVFRDGVTVYGAMCMKGQASGDGGVASRQPRDGTRLHHQQRHQQECHQQQHKQHQQQHHHQQQECHQHGSHHMTALEQLVADLQGFADGDDLGHEVLEVLVRLTALALKQEGLLDRLLAVQALDRIGPEGALRLYDQLLRELQDCGIMVTLQRAVPTAEALTLEPAALAPASASAGVATPVAGANIEKEDGGDGTCDLQHNGSMQEQQQQLLGQTLPEEPLGSAVTNGSAASVVHNTPRSDTTAAPAVSAAAASPAAGGGSSAQATSAASAGAAGSEMVQQPRVRVLEDPQSGATYLVKVAFVDLDVKAVAKIPRHVDLERALVTCAVENRSLLLTMAQQAGWTV
ncbi:hypothetical protein VOLCADRAFT_105293 [Volvox carteri f. nagariensis]|uniref:Inositol-pentakisphosphate 2-kinase n=1 Tax=Volvox carteri f. nagariensis TaxID=3068 RepID=D8TZU7_VOLCA|nr:uncharacterized protein VOLCADRAFT_105293 [Volvox carteri f. nagariensis]EFJ46985.1 hypothetical protein VOLCADRAFT_105293 [Volvox carteri f. nagariensis]|eukprot:XP_002951880.1 hypothetical protein VOLCADRAFT_105293 [Volvox carteri f. nagariensis]